MEIISQRCNQDQILPFYGLKTFHFIKNSFDHGSVVNMLARSTKYKKFETKDKWKMKLKKERLPISSSM